MPQVISNGYIRGSWKSTQRNEQVTLGVSSYGICQQQRRSWVHSGNVESDLVLSCQAEARRNRERAGPNVTQSQATKHRCLTNNVRSAEEYGTLKPHAHVLRGPHTDEGTLLPNLLAQTSALNDVNRQATAEKRLQLHLRLGPSPHLADAACQCGRRHSYLSCCRPRRSRRYW